MVDEESPDYLEKRERARKTRQEKEDWKRLVAEVTLLLKNFKLQLAAKTHRHFSYDNRSGSARTVFGKGIYMGFWPYNKLIGTILFRNPSVLPKPKQFKVEITLSDKNIDEDFKEKFRLQVEEFEKVLIDYGIMQKGNLTKKGF